MIDGTLLLLSQVISLVLYDNSHHYCHIGDILTWRSQCHKPVVTLGTVLGIPSEAEWGTPMVRHLPEPDSTDRPPVYPR